MQDARETGVLKSAKEKLEKKNIKLKSALEEVMEENAKLQCSLEEIKEENTKLRTSLEVAEALVESLKNKVVDTEMKSVESESNLTQELDAKSPSIQEHDAASKAVGLSSCILHELSVGDNELNNKLAAENEHLKVFVLKSLKYVLFN